MAFDFPLRKFPTLVKRRNFRRLKLCKNENKLQLVILCVLESLCFMLSLVTQKSSNHGMCLLRKVKQLLAVSFFALNHHPFPLKFKLLKDESLPPKCKKPPLKHLHVCKAQGVVVKRVEQEFCHCHLDCRCRDVIVKQRVPKSVTPHGGSFLWREGRFPPVERDLTVQR